MALTTCGSWAKPDSVLLVWKMECWLCGKKEGLTKHHAIPLRLKPLKNLVIPICRLCHDKINKDDMLTENLEKLLALYKSEKKGEGNYEDGDSAGRRASVKVGTEDASEGDVENLWEDLT